MLGSGQAFVGAKYLSRVVPGVFEKMDVGHKIGDLERRSAMLPRAEQLARSAKSKVLLGNPETVRCLAQDGEPSFGAVSGRVGEEQTA